MAQIEENETCSLDNIENIYEELTKVVNAKNEIQTTITLNSEELTRHQFKVEELEDILHNLRMKITTNPILEKLNITCEKDALDQRKSAEGIYSELPDISSKLEMYDEHFAKLKEEQERMEKLHYSLKDKFDHFLIQLTSSKVECEKRVSNSEITNKDISSKYYELKNEIDVLLNITSQEKDISKSLSFQKDCKFMILQKMKEIKEQNTKLFTSLDNLGMKTNDFSILEMKQVAINKDIESLQEKKNEIMNEIGECKRKISDEKILRHKLSEDLRKRELFSKKRNLTDRIEKMKIKSNARYEELLKLEENKQTQEKFLVQIDSELEMYKSGNKKMNDEVIMQKEKKQILDKEKKELNDNENELNKKLRVLNEKIASFSSNKSRLEVLINVSNEKKSLILNEIDKSEEKLRETDSLIKVLNEQIANFQTGITEKEKFSETPSYEEMEKENEMLDSKIKKYMKAIEALKKARAASILKKRKSYNGSSDSDDSMLLPKKKSRD